MLQKDRRIDPGMKYSPVFGRYSFIDKATEGIEIKVGDEVKVVKRNKENTLFGKFSCEFRFCQTGGANSEQTGLG